MRGRIYLRKCGVAVDVPAVFCGQKARAPGRHPRQTGVSGKQTACATQSTWMSGMHGLVKFSVSVYFCFVS